MDVFVSGRGARRSRPVVAFIIWTLIAATETVGAAERSPHPDRFTLFESGHVRPLALSADGRYLYAVDTPDNRLEIFRVQGTGSHSHQGAGSPAPLEHVASVRVGLEPVTVAVRDRHQVWVVNHLSDSVSVVDVTSPATAHVTRTLLVGDEPRDIVFAGPGRRRAFVTAAHRGQNNPNDPQLTTPGIGRADVWVFDADDLGTALGGEPTAIVTLFADSPRALAASPDGRRVYAAAFHSGNRTASLEGFLVTDGGPAAPDGLGLPAPIVNVQGLPQPEDGIILKHDGEHWRDPATGRDFDAPMRFTLPDYDVFTIDAMADPPVEVPGSAVSGVGTVLFAMAVNPATGRLYVANTEARNDLRFEGPGLIAGTSLRGHLHEARVTVIGDGPAEPRHLNKHIDYDACCAALPNDENDRSLAQPTGLAVTGDGATLYVSAFGSAKVGVFSTAALEDDSFVPDPADHIELSGGGPTGVVLDADDARLYVLTRFDNSVTVIDTATRAELARVALFNPEPDHVVGGRPLLFDARATSSNGESSCASCHVFGDLDSLAWNLGNPDDVVRENPGPFTDPQTPFPGAEDFHPMKGPMTTQSLRGMANHGPMHWRGDRNGNDEAGTSAQPDTGLFDERQAFSEFNPAFETLLGGPRQLTAAEMTALTDYVLELTYPPNPIRNLDNSLTPTQARGRDHFFRFGVAELNPVLPSPLGACQDCHRLDPFGNAELGVDKPGFFGTTGLGVVETSGFQHIKVPHLRNLYQKVGMFGLAPFPFLPPFHDYSHQGDQIRGFGFLHNGGVDTVFRFISSIFFSDLIVPEGFPFTPDGDTERRDVEAFLLAFDSNLAPIVGQQVTIDHRSRGDSLARLDLLIARARTEPAECEVVASARFATEDLSFLYLAATDRFQPNDHDWPSLTRQELRLLAWLRPVTFTCVPLGSGQRIGLDADLDGCYDRSEARRGFDPRDPNRTPPGCP